MTHRWVNDTNEAFLKDAAASVEKVKQGARTLNTQWPREGKLHWRAQGQHRGTINLFD